VNNQQQENKERLDYLCRHSHKWLLGAAFKVCKNLDTANELVADLYLYLGERINPALWYDEGDIRSFNLQYCRKFIHSRNLNRIKRDGKTDSLYDNPDEMDTEYDYDSDERIEKAYSDVLKELKRLERTRLWAPAKLASLYFYEDYTLDGLAKEIKISKSATFLNIKKIKTHLKNKIDNPFKPSED
jgi:DNA-directed RNA polymerase specialized sigma24 family protein